MGTACSLTLCRSIRQGVCMSYIPLAMHAPLPHMPPWPCTPPCHGHPPHIVPPAMQPPMAMHTPLAMDTPSHAHTPSHVCPLLLCMCPLPCTSPAMHALHHTCPPAMHPPCHACPLPHMPAYHAQPSTTHTPGGVASQACKSIAFAATSLRVVTK